MPLIEFYGDGCPHCQKMAPKVEDLEKEKGIKIQQLEVWNNKKNAEKQVELDDGRCGGVPFFYNTETDEYICGETDKEKLEKWANGKEVN